MSIDQTRDRLAEVLTGPLAEAGYDLEALELTPAGKRRVLRVAVDKDGGVTLDDVAEASRQVARLVEEADAMGEQPYTLEVTSPGTDRPLTLPRHWRRNRGRLVKLTRSGGATVVGRVLDSDDNAAVLDLGGTRERVPYAEVAKARVEIEFNRKGS